MITDFLILAIAVIVFIALTLVGLLVALSGETVQSSLKMRIAISFAIVLETIVLIMDMNTLAEIIHVMR